MRFHLKVHSQLYIQIFVTLHKLSWQYFPLFFSCYCSPQTLWYFHKGGPGFQKKLYLSGIEDESTVKSGKNKKFKKSNKIKIAF